MHPGYTLVLPRYLTARSERPVLPQFLLLSMLLHLLVIVMFGTISGSAAKRGELWGQIQVTLRGLAPDSARPGNPASTTGAASPGAAIERTDAPPDRQSKASPATAPAAAAPPTPAQPAPTETLPRLNPAAPEQVDKAYVPAPASPPDAVPIVVPQRIEPLIPRRIERELTGPTELVPPTVTISPPALQRIAPPRSSREMVPSVELRPRPAPIVPAPLERIAPRPNERALTPPVELVPREPLLAPAPIERVLPRRIERNLAPPLELVPREAPVVPAPIERIAPRPIERNLAPPVELTPREAPAVPAPIERVAPRRIERDLAPPVEVTPHEATAVPAPIERIAPPRMERDLAPPVEVKPFEAPAVAAPIERIVPRAIERELAPPVELRPPELPMTPAPIERIAPPPVVQRQVPPATDLQGATSSAVESLTARETAVPSSIPRAQDAAPRADSPAANVPERFRFGSPAPEDEIFRPRGGVMPPAAEPGGQPYLDLQAARSRAVREIATDSSGSRSVFQLAPPAVPDEKSKDARAIEKAIKPDCRTAYAGLGLLAIPVLVAAALAETGCNW